MSGKISLRLRKLEDGSLIVGEFPSRDDALTWLKERPHMIEVLGVAAELDPDDEQALRAALRPLDAEESRLSHALDEARLSAMRTAVERESARLAQDARARAGGSDADRDPNRPLQIAYDEAEGMTHADPSDDRPISDVVQAAVLGWVTERNSWVHGRGQHVARAMLMVWPGPVPGGDEADRVQSGGQFETAPGAIDPPN